MDESHEWSNICIKYTADLLTYLVGSLTIKQKRGGNSLLRDNIAISTHGQMYNKHTINTHLLYLIFH